MGPIKSYKYGINTAVAGFGAVIGFFISISSILILFSGRDLPFGTVIAIFLFMFITYIFSVMVYAAFKQKNKLNVYENHMLVPMFFMPWNSYEIDLNEVAGVQRKLGSIIIVLKDKTVRSLSSANMKSADMDDLFAYLKERK